MYVCVCVCVRVCVEIDSVSYLGICFFNNAKKAKRKKN